MSACTQRTDLRSSTQTSCIIYLEHPRGTECTTERIHTVLLVIRSKVIDVVMFLTPISAEEMSSADSYRIEIGCAFFVTFFAQAKKVEMIRIYENTKFFFSGHF